MIRSTAKCITQAKLASPKSCVYIRKCATQNRNTENNVSKSPKYTQEESEKILTLINTLQLPEYESYNLSKRRAGKLLEWKSRNGSFKNLDDIYLIDGFGTKVVEKLYQSLLKEPDSNGDKKVSRLRNASFLKPPIDFEQRQQLRSSVSLRVGVASVSWARMEIPSAKDNSPCLLTHWQHTEITDKKLHLQDLIERCLHVDHQIPEADCYLFENPQMAQVNRNPGNADQQNISIQKSQLTAVLSFALNRRNPSKTEDRRPNVFYLRRFLTARLFNHLVGTERVSSEETILKLMRTHYNSREELDFVYENADDDKLDNKAEDSSDLSLRGEVLFSSELRQMFAQSERSQRELLGQCLLLNLAFIRLVLLQDPNSIALLSRKTFKDSNNVEKD